MSPEDCSHDDVAEEWNRALETSDSLGLSPPPAAIVDQRGLCRLCGARVTRHGTPGAWTPWMVDPEPAADN